MALPLATAPASADGRPAVYGIRPEHFAIADDGAEAEIVVVEPTGSETQVFAKLGGEEVVAVFRERHQFKPGDKIRLKPDPQLVHLFDETTGKRLNAEPSLKIIREKTTMTIFTRRTLLQGGTAAAAAGALTGPALLDWAKAWAQTAPWKPEQGAQLSMLRWKYFVQSEDDSFVALLDAFTKATGVKVNVTRESYEDIPPKASVAANTNAGPDLFWGLFSLPHLFPQKCVDVTDVADYLGKKYGGWVPTAVTYGKSGNKWIAIPICFGGNMLNYRISALKKAGFSKFPATTDEFLEYAKATKREQYARRHGARPRHRRRQLLGALVPVGARRQRVDAKDKVILNSPETEKALDYAKQLYDNMIPGTAAWNDAFNNKAFLAGEVSWTNNGISIYAAAKRDATKKEIAEDMDHACGRSDRSASRPNSTSAFPPWR